MKRLFASRLLVALVLAAAGATEFGQGVYIHAKALLAQVLLERAFAETIATGQAVKHGLGPIPGPTRASR